MQMNDVAFVVLRVQLVHILKARRQCVGVFVIAGLVGQRRGGILRDDEVQRQTFAFERPPGIIERRGAPFDGRAQVGAWHQFVGAALIVATAGVKEVRSHNADAAGTQFSIAVPNHQLVGAARILVPPIGTLCKPA